MNPKTMINLVSLVLLGGCGGVEWAPAEERDAYLPQIEVADVRVGKTMTGRYFVSGQVHNKGNRPVTAALIKIDWLDPTGAAIGSTTENCVSEELAPDTMQEFRVSADEAPESWDHKVNVEFTDLAFGN